jgi:hypothetical protein
MRANAAPWALAKNSMVIVPKEYAPAPTIPAQNSQTAGSDGPDKQRRPHIHTVLSLLPSALPL